MNATMEDSTTQNGVQSHWWTQYSPATVLLVEDEPAVREVTRAALEIGGYRVLEADGSATAERIASDDETEIDLLLTDVVMPGMNGAELARRICESRPELVTLFMTGYADSEVLRSGNHGLDPETYSEAVHRQWPAGTSGRRIGGTNERPQESTSSAVSLPLISLLREAPDV